MSTLAAHSISILTPTLIGAFLATPALPTAPLSSLVPFLGGSGRGHQFRHLPPIGVTDVTIQVTSYDHNVFNPDTIAGADGIFTLRFNFPG